MDEDKYNFIPQRHKVPDSAEFSELPRPWGPYYLGIYDLADIRNSGALFMRKVNKEVDPNIFHLLPVNKREEIPNIGWPKQVQISSKMHWQHFPWDSFKNENYLEGPK